MGQVQDTVQNAKAWWQSKTIIGTILMILPTVIKIIFPNSNIDVPGAVDDVWSGAEGLAGYADSIWATVQEAIGFALALYGRLKANVNISKKLI